MKIGYARVSTDEQNLSLQRDALKKAGCKKIVADKGVSGNSTQRDGLDRALKQLKKRGCLGCVETRSARPLPTTFNRADCNPSRKRRGVSKPF